MINKKFALEEKISHRSIVIATHYRIYSASQALRDYLKKHNCKKLLYIAQPLPPKVIQKVDYSFYEVTSPKKVTQKNMGRKMYSNLPINSIYNTYFILKSVLLSGRYDLFIGINNLNALAGLTLKRMGRVKKVIYYTIDYFPTRFNNRFLNNIYHFIDKLCVRFSDETWNVSSVMADAREKHNAVDRATNNRQYKVPIGIWYDKAPRKNFLEIDKKKLIFVGQLLPHMGVDLVVKTMPEIIKKIPDIKLEIIGGGEQKKYLMSLSKTLGIQNHITFWGWVRDRRKLERIMSDGAVGLATFNTEILDEKVKNADPGKIKDYMLLGMPVIVTDAISNADEIRKRKCGIVIRYKNSDLVNAVVKLLSDENKLAAYRKSALTYVQQFDYAKLFDENLSRVFLHI